MVQSSSQSGCVTKDTVESKTCSLHHNFLDKNMVLLNRTSVLGSFRKCPRVTVCNGEESSRLADVVLGGSSFIVWLVDWFWFFISAFS